MRRWLPFLGIVLGLATGAVWLWGHASDDGPGPTALEAPGRRTPPRAFAEALPVATVAERGLQAARLEGRVLRRGAMVFGANVVARSGARETLVVSSPEGRFALEGLPPGSYLLAASLGSEASPLVGPLLLEPGQARRGLELELAAAGSVSGVVLDAVSRKPIAGARVTSSGGRTATDDSGRFRLFALPPGETWIEASADGYLGRVEWLTLEAARAHEGMELYLRPGARLRGTVTRGGRPVAAATVWGEPLATAGSARLFGPVLSKADGTFELWAGGGTLRLAAAGPSGSRVEGQELTLGEGATRDGLVLELGQELSAEGVVRVDGQPRAGVALFLLDAKRHQVVGATTSGGAGQFRFDGVSPGDYLVQAETGPIFAQRGPFDFTGEPGETWRVDLTSGSALFGRVVPAAAGVLVRWRSTEWAGEAVAEGTTDLRGAFRFEAVPPGALSVEAEGEVGTARAQGRAGAEVVLLLRRAAVRGLVQDERRQPVADFTVRLTPLGGGSTRAYPVLSPTGDFRVEAPPGKYQVTATAAGHGEAESPQTVEVGESEPFVKLTLLGTVDVRGRVRDAADGSPVPGVEVAFNRMGRDRRHWSGRWATAVTAADGTFEVGAAPSDAVLDFRKAGYVPLWTAIEPVPRDADGRLAISLRKGDPASGGGYEPYEGIGAQLAQTGSKVVVAFAFEGSPAEAAGLVPGDEIVSVDGRPSAGLPLADLIHRIMGPAGTVVRLGLVRGDQALEVQIRRRSIQF